MMQKTNVFVFFELNEIKRKSMTLQALSDNNQAKHQGKET